MKIVPKLTLSLIAGTCLIVAGNGYLRVRREIATFEEERVRDHEMIGRALAAAATAVWKTEGEGPALASVDAVNEHFRRIRTQWIAEGGATHIDAAALAATPAGQPVTRTVHEGDTIPTWYTYVPIEIDRKRRGALELAEPAVGEQRFVRTVLVDALRTALAIAFLSAILSFVMGQWVVGNPVRALAEKARRIGRGDFTRPIVLMQKDELSDLAAEMNAMCDRLVGTLEQLRHADRLAIVGKLASGVAHELGTPLNVVSARASMIAEGETTPEESREYARVISGSAERMAKIIRQLLQFARREGIRKAATNVRALTKETLELLRPLAANRSVELEIERASAETAAPVDAGQLQQVISNLVMNAIQATPRGGHVKLRWYDKDAQPPPDVGAPAGRYLCLDVEDDGEGIRPESLPRVFEPFFTTKDVGEGTGLGLAVSYGIIRDHGGWITVKSERGKGTTFTVLVPAAALP
jgi:two-component system NtrC family sensor kinase